MPLLYWALGAILMLFATLFVLGACRVAGDADRQAQRDYEAITSKRSDDHGIPIRNISDNDGGRGGDSGG